MPQVSHISTIYSRCWLKKCDGKSLTLGYEMRQPADYQILVDAIDACSVKHTTSQGAHVLATPHDSWGNGNSNGFDVTFEAAPIQTGLGLLSRPFTKGEINTFAYALKNAGCISEAARIGIERAVNALGGSRRFP